MKDTIVTLDMIMESASSYIKNVDSLNTIRRAYAYAEEKHAGQFRKSGEPYVNHLANVAYILTTLNTAPATIIAGLLHDTMEDVGVTKEELTAQFGEEITRLVEGVTKIGSLQFKDEQEYLAENHRKIFIAMAKDIRVILIKLADRLHNMRTLSAQPEPKQRKIAKETLDVYSPIAHRLGISELKNELEDLAFFYLEREKYYEIARLVESKKSERDNQVKEMIMDMSNLLEAQGLRFRIFGRSKHLYSIFKKMSVKHKRFEDIFDLLAIRIITDSELSCYEILGLIHAAYKPIPGRFKDYIAMPKPNMYQSLHTTIVEIGNIFEVQIRTENMDMIAEKGVAAHWRYKEGVSSTVEEAQREIEAKLQWFRDLVAMTDDSDSQDAQEYMHTLQQDIFEANVYVLSPKGRVVELPNGSTPLDFAYRIHTEVGHATVGAVVNGGLVPLNTVLKTGDVVEINTSKQSHGPSKDWLKLVKTTHARNKIKAFFMKQDREDREEVIEKGISLFKEELKKRGLVEKEYTDPKKLEHIFQHFAVSSYDDLMYAIAMKSLSSSAVIERISAHKRNALLENLNITKLFTRPSDALKRKTISKTGIIVQGIDGMLITLAGCCNPIPGDDIAGYISKGQGVKVHRRDCPNIANETKRLIHVEWDPDTVEGRKYEVELVIIATDRNYLISDLVTIISQCKASLLAVQSQVNEDRITATTKVKITVDDSEHLRMVTANLRKVNSVILVDRLIH